ncbi:MAG TPA: MBL fold metallo-hydrolase [Rhodospirillales bacterium]|jgi:phosphoribosyl 1,2-cyclic phosphate phosphodiesterase|nr:MBL fold metallo-hydrolase [Rhodospirillales bacterium]HJO68425.1 MBL fold metallo-hydrolase [Rhodospirillales bacterium]
MRLTILGCGSSSGTPSVDGGWGRCDPANPRNRRLRPAVLVENGDSRLLVDTPPDLRQQLIDTGVDALDAVLFTHYHADHLHGIDDLRPVNRRMRAPLDAYADVETFRIIGERFGYVLTPLPPETDFYFKPVLVPHLIRPGESFDVGAIPVTPFDQDHGVCRTLGFRFRSIAYSTDVVRLDADALATLGGVAVWIIGTLGERPHPTHAHVDLALEWIEVVKPGRTILTGLGSGLDYETLKRRLPAGVEPAYDGMVIEVPDA